MISRWLWRAVVLGLVAVLALLFLRPEPMLSPGAPMRAHQDIGGDCFACHTPLLGVRAERCLSCHALDRIGLFTSKGRPIPADKSRPPFHQKLSEQNCTACHGEHQGADAKRALRTFSHQMLQPGLRSQCASCHARPEDALHRQVGETCAQCHGQTAWSPATFEHDRYFLLDRDHNVACATCHVGQNFSRYTCYGCHEHSPAGIRAEHEEEGIRDFQRCVKCHRGADEGEAHGRHGDDD
ncbi:MAG: class III cytochrome C family protein [Nevskiaceae bacterium]|nr:MAG: class III cytochrome C family protein [Nevskiaceae bacterium]TAM32906.1 MAG: class III cytochrome C family protein [Nevskiaceae bacterium]